MYLYILFADVLWHNRMMMTSVHMRILFSRYKNTVNFRFERAKRVETGVQLSLSENPEVRACQHSVSVFTELVPANVCACHAGHASTCACKATPA